MASKLTQKSVVGSRDILYFSYTEYQSSQVLLGQRFESSYDSNHSKPDSETHTSAGLLHMLEIVDKTVNIGVFLFFVLLYQAGEEMEERHFVFSVFRVF